MTAQRVAVLGAGSWGTTFAKVLVDAGRDAVLWARRPEVADAIAQDRCNPDYLPGVQLPASLKCSVDAAEVISGADLVVLAVAARRGALVAEGGGDVPRLPRQDRAVLDEAPYHRGGPFGPQGERLHVRAKPRNRS